MKPTLFRMPPPFVVATLIGTSAAAGQTLPPAPTPWSLHAGAGLLLSVPDDFERDRCGALAGYDVRLGARRALSSALAVESAVAVGGTWAETCAFDAVPRPDNGTLTRRVVGDGVDGDPYVATEHRLVLEAMPSASVGPTLSLGGGRYWTQGAWFWSAGMGVRLGRGPTRWSIEVERRGFRLAYHEEVDRYRDGVLVSTTPSAELHATASLWGIRLRRTLR